MRKRQRMAPMRKERSKRSTFIAGLIMILVTLLLSFDKIQNTVECREFSTNNHQQDNTNNKHTSIDKNDNNNDNRNIDRALFYEPNVMLQNNNRDTNFQLAEQQRDPGLLKTVSNGDANQQLGAMLRSLPTTKSFLDKNFGMISGNDHELPAEYYYYYHVQQKKQQPSLDQSIIDNNAFDNINDNHAGKSGTRYGYYPDNDLGNYLDMDKRSDAGTTMSTIDNYLPRSSLLRDKLYEIIYQDMNVANNGRQVLKRGRGSSSCNFNSGLTSKCDNMDYLQAWNHHNWFHKTTLPG